MLASLFGHTMQQIIRVQSQVNEIDIVAPARPSMHGYIVSHNIMY